MSDVDMVNHPPHYTSHPSGVEWIAVGRHLTADWMNAGKYVFRSALKSGLEDLEKARWYAQDALTHDMPVHGPSWRFKHQQSLQRIIDAELDETRGTFFQMLLIGNRSAATTCIALLIDEFKAS